MNFAAQFPLSLLIQSVMIFGADVAASLLIRKPEVRLGLLRYAFLGLVAVAAVRLAAPGIANPWLSEKAKPYSRPQFDLVRTTPVSSIQPGAALPSPAVVVGKVEHSVAPTPSPAVSRLPEIDLAQLLLLVWVTGAALLFARILAGLTWLRRLRLSSKPLNYSPVAERLARLASKLGVGNVAMAESGLISSPLVAGFRKPTVY